jgi:hypothetical protein
MITHTIAQTIVDSVIQNYAPLVITSVISFLAFQWNKLIKAKTEEHKNNNLVSGVLSNLTIKEAQENFLKEKALDGIKFAEEQAFKAWKDDNKEELSSLEKRDIAYNQVKPIVSELRLPFNTQDILKNIESVLSINRNDLDRQYQEAKANFIALENKVPENSRILQDKN